MEPWLTCGPMTDARFLPVGSGCLVAGSAVDFPPEAAPRDTARAVFVPAGAGAGGGSTWAVRRKEGEVRVKKEILCSSSRKHTPQVEARNRVVHMQTRVRSAENTE